MLPGKPRDLRKEGKDRRYDRRERPSGVGCHFRERGYEFPTDSFLGSVALSADGRSSRQAPIPRMWKTRFGSGICERESFSGFAPATLKESGGLRSRQMEKPWRRPSTDQMEPCASGMCTLSSKLLAVNNMAAFSELLFAPGGSVLITRTSGGVVALSAPHDDK